MIASNTNAEVILPLRYFNYHAPEAVRMFSVPDRGIRRWDDEAVVYDVRVGTNQVLRHYSFSNRWFEVNCSLDLDGRFVTEAGPIAWTFNCDISTPHFAIGGDLYNMDLWLDVLVGPDGRQHQVIDEDDFAEAVARGWLTETEQLGARQGLSELLGIIGSEGLVSFLDRVWPFQNIAVCAEQPPMQKHPVSQFPCLDPAQRDLRYAK